MITLKISPCLYASIPGISAGLLSCRIDNGPSDEKYWNGILPLIKKSAAGLSRKDIRRLPEISAARSAYKSLGTDPSRYRISSEALLNRIADGKALYRVNRAVDCANVISIQSRLSVCLYDAKKIEGSLELGIGHEEDVMEAIGGMMMKMRNLPVYRDHCSIIGSVTRDSLRTCVYPETTEIIGIVTSFSGAEVLPQALELFQNTVKKELYGINIETTLISP